MAVNARTLDGGTWPYLGSLGLGAATLVPAVLAGLVGGLYAVVASVSYPALIFSGDLQDYQAIGIGMALLGSTILATVVALTSSFPGAVATAQSEPATVLGVMAGSLAVGLGTTTGTDGADLLPTVVALIVLSSATLGLAFLALGTFRLANLIRYIPYPVIGGFLAGVGWLVVAGAFSALTGKAPHPGNLAYLAQAEVLLRWAPALVLAGVLWRLQRRRSHFFNLLGVVLAAVALFWTAAWLAGVSMAALRDGRWLLGPFPEAGLWPPLQYLETPAQVDWALVLGQLPEIGTLLILCLLMLLVTASSLELLARRDVDLNRELCSAGIANILCGVFGGFPGYHSLSGSSLACNVGAPVRLIGFIVALLCALTLAVGASVLAYVPKLVIGVILLYVGLSLLIDSLYDSYARMPLGEYLVLVTVFAGVVLIGVIEGIVIGVAAGVILFVVNYGRIDVVREVLSGATVCSNVDRPEKVRGFLREHGDECHVLKLQGYIFFGTSSRLLLRIRDRLADASSRPLRFLVLDFGRVSGLDSSALNSFTKLVQYAEKWDFTLVLTALSPDIAHALRTAGVDRGLHPRVRVFPDLDRGLEYSEEDALLAARRSEPPVHADPLEHQLGRIFPQSAEVNRLLSYMEQETWREGQYLIRQGDASEDMFFIESGRVSVQLELAPEHTLRLRTMGAGTVVGEMALYLGLPRSASVVADTPTSARRLTAARLALMKRDDPQVAAMLHEFLARTLAARLADTNRPLEVYAD